MLTDRFQNMERSHHVDIHSQFRFLKRQRNGALCGKVYDDVGLQFRKKRHHIRLTCNIQVMNLNLREKNRVNRLKRKLGGINQKILLPGQMLQQMPADKSGGPYDKTLCFCLTLDQREPRVTIQRVHPFNCSVIRFISASTII